MHLKRQELDVADRVDEAKIAGGLPVAEILDPLARTRVDGEDDRDIAADFIQSLDERAQRVGIVDVRRPVQCDQRIRSIEDAIVAPHAPGFREELDQRIDHDVADAVDLFCIDAFAQEIAIPVVGGREEKVGQLIRHQAIDFLGHRAIARSKAGFDVGDRNEELGAHERRGSGRVDVAVDHHQIGPALEDDRLEADHDFGGLRGMRAAADGKVEVRFRNSELLKEDVRHEGVVVLTGVDERLTDAVLPECSDHGSGFHEIWSSTDDVKNVHGVPL